MVNLHIAHTSPINPSGASPTLTPTQIWAGLQRKIRHAEEFVPVIESCEVISEEESVVTREVVFKKGQGPKDRAREVVRGFEPSWVDFEQEDGTHIRNIISNGPSGQAHDLHMTYTFEFRFPQIEQGSPEAENELKRLKGMAKMAVEKSIETIRDMVKAGKIPGDQ